MSKAQILFTAEEITAKSKFTHKDLIPIAYRWVLKNASCGVAFKELVTLSSECPDVLGIQSGTNTVLIEVKVTRSDFLADRKKPFRIYPEKGMGTFRFYLCPQGLIKPEELPLNWGLIYVSALGKAKCNVNPYCKTTSGNIWSGGFANKNAAAEMGMMYSALRRLHIKGHLESIYDKQYQYNHKD